MCLKLSTLGSVFCYKDGFLGAVERKGIETRVENLNATEL